MVEVVDLFAGPGGLGEGFSSFSINGDLPFKIKISIEKERFAHETLTLRSFYRQFKKAPGAYYKYLRGEITKELLFNKYPQEAKKAINEAICAELGSEVYPHDWIMQKINAQVSNPRECVVIGGPPCQAYSLVGRSKMNKWEDFNTDPRHTLYKEYLRIIADLKPAMFVMENVKGILSSKLSNEFIFDKILEDIKTPALIKNPDRKRFRRDECYTIYSLATNKPPHELDRQEYVIRCENYGIPQCRHRVILLAVRNDIKNVPEQLKKVNKQITVEDVISDLPKLRSGLSKESDARDVWENRILEKFPTAKIHSSLTRGGEFMPHTEKVNIYQSWFHDRRLKGVLNHTTRAHISSDLHRYYFIASYSIQNGFSAKLQDLPEDLLPNHKNVKSAVKSKSLFNDRFRVQLSDKPATTITSHISKDGHYFIHYDPSQCRSLTVREAARIQTFPDNYKFEGPRTSQYQQVGNAVPPLLAKNIAAVVFDLMERDSTNS